MAKGDRFPTEWRTFTDDQTGVEVRQLTNHKGHSHHLYFTNPGWYDGGRKLLFGLIIAGLTIPTMMLIIPQFILAKDLGLLNSLPGLVPFYVGTALGFNTFLLSGFFETIPRELDEAMLMDGAGAWRRYFHLALPLSKPALATVVIFSFLGSWDEFV